MSNRLSDVATHLGISESSVSRALNGKEGVSTQTRQAVLTALDVLGYERPSKLHHDRTRSIGLVLADHRRADQAALAEVSSSVLAAQEFLPVLAVLGARAGADDVARQLEGLLAQEVAGLLLIGFDRDRVGARTLLDRASRTGLAAVSCCGSLDRPGVPSVVVDRSEALGLALGHLRGLGHGAIGVLSGAGWASALEESPGPDVRHHGLPAAGAAGEAAHELWAGGATALVVEDASTALWVTHGLREHGVVVPRDCSVVALADDPLAPFAGPPLTVVRPPVEDMARAAVSILLERLDGPHDVPAHQVRFSADLILRGSTAVPRGR